MKMKPSAYLLAVKPHLRALIDELNAEYPYVSIFAQDSLSMQCSVSRSGVTAAESAMLTNRGFVLRVHNGQGYAEYSFNYISADTISEIADRVRAIAATIQGNDPIPTDEPACESRALEYALDPEEMGCEEIVKRLTDLRTKALSKSEQLLDAAARLVWQKSHRMFLSPNRDLMDDMLFTNGSIVAMAARGEEIKDYYKGFSGLCGAELFDEMMDDRVLDEIVSTVIALLDSQPIPPGEYDCICSPETTGMIVHEAFGHGVEMDMFVKNRALAREYVGKRVASDLVNMHDGAAAARECASFLFDDEGTLGMDTHVIEKGFLVGGYADAVSAARLNIKPTGNGRRESFERKAYTRMTNTFFEGGTDSVEDMIASIKYGFMLENPSSGMEDPKNWGIQCMVNFAREIRDGRLTGRIFSPIVLTGYVPDLLKSISMMSPDVRLGGGGFCGKGYKEWVKVSDGGPYMKARIRLG